jgi:deoxyribodipyrimidine photo-lyase
MLNDLEERKGKYVLYWMQAAQRVEYNHALEYAVYYSNSLKVPLLAVFCIVDKYPYSNISQYRFMIEGLQEVQKQLEKRGIPFVALLDTPERVIPSIAEDASLVVVDRDYQRLQRKWRTSIAQSIECPLHQVETNVVVPIEAVSPKEEYSAGTIRPKVHRILEDYLVPLRKQRVKISSEGIGEEGIDLTDIDTVLKRVKVENDITQDIRFRGGTSKAKKLLKQFISQDLDVFATLRNDPSIDRLSKMSPYLHFGQISPLFIALQVRKANSPGTDTYLEELIIRRELSMNFVFFNSNYDTFECLPNWAKETLEFHSFDNREYIYSFNELENATTHDPYWNAAQKEMVHTGKMHGYMRMYWGKKIIEWTESPFDAYETCIKLNDSYELDGRDPNGYAGVAWCFGKHDRAWGERAIFGKVRYMNDKGLKRKFNIEAYVDRTEEL